MCQDDVALRFFLDHTVFSQLYIEILYLYLNKIYIMNARDLYDICPILFFLKFHCLN